MKLIVSQYEKKNVHSFLINHKALVYVDGWNGEHEELAIETSIECLYHPAGYGLYNYEIVPTSNENEYWVKWQTAASCD